MERGSCLFPCGREGAGRGTGVNGVGGSKFPPVGESLPGRVGGDRCGKDARTARITLGLGLTGSDAIPEGFVSALGVALSISH